MSQKIVKGTDELASDLWSIPHVEQAKQANDDKTNAIGKKSTWKYEPPEETELEEPVPLTAEDIEEIRQAAHEEGYNQGKEEGFTKGYEEGKSAGHEEGLKSGHEEGIETGLSEGKETINSLAKEWETLTQQLHKPLADVEKNVEAQLLHLVVQLTQAITLQEAKTNPDIITSAIVEGIKILPSQEAQTQILIHPADIKIVEEQFGQAYIAEQGWKLLAAPQLEQGSCQIENSTSNVDLNIKSRMKDVLDSFLQEALHQ